MKELKDVIAGSGKVVEQVYSDAVSDSMKEISKIGVDAVKTFRLALFPLQFTSAIQDRLANYIKKAVEQVPVERRVEPVESLVLPIAEKLRFQEEGNLLSDLYVNLLSRAMDKERLGEAHPGFITVISQMAPDEAILLKELGEKGCQIWWRNKCDRKKALSYKKSSEVLVDLYNSNEIDLKYLSALNSISVVPEELVNPDLFLVFLEHLVDLGLINYTNEKPPVINNISNGKKFGNYEYHIIELSGFGQLFYAACLNYKRKVR